MKNLTLSLLGLISILFATTTQAQVAEQARNYQINATHTGANSVENLTPPLRQRWVVNFGRSISYPLIADGKVYVTVKNATGQGTTLFALDATNGATVWSFALGGVRPWSAACYENGRVFAVNNDGLLRAFDGATGNLIWSVQLPGQFFFTAPPTVFQGVIYTSGAGSGGTVYAVNANSGAVLWTKSVINGDMSSPAVDNEGVYVSYSCPNVYKLNPTTGAVIWHYTTGCSGGGGKTPALYNGRLYVRDFSDTIFDSQTGTIIGNFNAKNTPTFSSSRGFFLNGPHFFGSFGTLEARDVNTDSVLWSFAGDGQLQSAVLVVNDYVYVGSAQGRLYAVDSATGQQVWGTTAGASIPFVDEQNVSQPLTSFAAAEGLLVVPTSTTLVAYERDPGDTTPPTLTWGSQTPAANAFGWNNTPVDLPFTTADDLSGVQSTVPGSPLHFTSEGANLTQQVTVTDNAGNSATFTSPLVNIDTSAPVVSAAANPATAKKSGKPVTVTISGSVTDGLSGVSSASFNVIDEYGAAQPSGAVTVQPNGSYSFTL
ncbi:MAG TPA: PQQ-binding-like beta-propeller repeat protein, partial [Pyrinomonadaceae bacterium]|nr:PQQ-binding-like beta-propeller repeat protein [Pyrinomonadaceae bacterium]